MPIPKMMKVEIIAHEDHKVDLVDRLYELGVVEIQELSEVDESTSIDESTVNDIEKRLADLSYAINFLQTFGEKPGLLESFFVPRYKVKKTDYYDVIKTYDLSFLEIVKEADQNLSEIRNEETRLQTAYEQFLPWANVDIALKDFEAEKTITELVTIPKDYLDQLSSLWYVHIQIQDSTERKSWVAMTYLKEYREELDEFLRKVDFQKILLPTGFEGTPREVLEKIKVNMDDIQNKKQVIEKKCSEMARERFHLMMLYDYYKDIKMKYDVRRLFSNTEKTFRLQGWIRERDTKTLEKSLTSLLEVDISSDNPPDNEEVPVAIDNKRVLRPFEVVTNIYGLPLYKEVDPTSLLAPFFIVFFGLCLSDFFYGIALIGLSIFVLKKIKIGPDAQLLFRLLIVGGFISIVLGILTGGWAGDLPNYFPEQLSFVRDVRISSTLLDVLQNPILMLEIVLVLGLFQVWIGILIRGYMNVRDKYYLDAVFDQGLWLILLPIGTLTLINKMFGVSVPYPDLMFKVSLGALAGLVLTQGRYQKASNIVLTIFKKALVGVLSIYNIFGYLGDVLSYSRILALGLATAALASAFNMVAAQFQDVRIIGPVVMIVLLIGLHLLNLIISVLGAFVHSGRLQFVEYFTKFLEGGGKTFRPFGFHPKYIEIMEEK